MQIGPASSHLSLPVGCQPLCRACPHRSLSIDESLKKKAEFLRQCLKLEKEIPIFGSVNESTRWGTRTKAVLHVRPAAEDHLSPSKVFWKLGMLGPFSKGFERELLDLRECPQHSPAIRKLHAFLETIPWGPEAFAWHFAVISGQLLTLVLKQKELPPPALLSALAGMPWGKLGLMGVFLNLNPSCGNRVLRSKGFHLIWGVPLVRDSDGLPLYGPSSFTQGRAELHQQSIDSAADFLLSDRPQALVDLYSGSGATGIRWQKARIPWLGVELSSESVAIARERLSEERILIGRCEERIP
jgi:tRNA/tmRNA/rRNA uracil-C5-methylase (TrmA/RlmC/RlmD family)